METYPFIRKCLALGIIFLFLGIAVQPITSINIAQINELESINKLNNSYREEDCNCEDVTTQDIAEVNRLLDKTEIKIKNILLTYGYIPDVKLKCNEFLKLLNTIDPDGPICKLLELLYLGLRFFIVSFFNKAGDLYEKGRYVLSIIYLLIYTCLLYTIAIPYVLIVASFGCSWAQYSGPDFYI